jgi:hypothetical protein
VESIARCTAGSITARLPSARSRLTGEAASIWASLLMSASACSGSANDTSPVTTASTPMGRATTTDRTM